MLLERLSSGFWKSLDAMRGDSLLKKKLERWLVSMAGCLLVLVSAAGHAVDLFSAAPASGFVIGNTGVRNTAAAAGSANAAGGSATSYREQLLDAAGQDSVHAATLANLPGGDVGVWWYGGSREGAKDVQIWFARYDHRSGEFSPVRSVMSRHQLSTQLGRYIKKLGNPAAVLDSNGRLWLFFVSVSVGGWAGSSVNFIVSDDGGETWSPARRLATSPFFNVSTLVRTPPVLLESGALAVPIYHGFIGRFAEILIVEPDGTVRNKHRLTWGRDAIQPSLAPVSRDRGAVFMRYAGDPPLRMLYSATGDSGRNFSRPRKLDLPNADNSVAAGALPDGSGIWIVYNSSETGREVLSIAVADNDVSEAVRAFDLVSGEGEFSYPAIVTDAQGQHHVAWTHQRRNIKHAVFNDAWLFNTVRAQPAAP